MTIVSPAHTDLSDETAPTRYLVGIDLGTTNSALAYVDTVEQNWMVRDFAVPQLVAAGTIETRATLPSFHYEPAAGEFPPGTCSLPWTSSDQGFVVGTFARDHGAAVPGRLVVSAKSWLSHSGVDRTAGLLPWHGSADVQRLSPVQVSSRYLAYLRAAWDAAHPEHPMARQDIVLTVPASFDEVARELTVAAAREAGLVKVVLAEEPQAAFYNWIEAQGEHWESRVRPGQTILVCDIGGGTSDFTLIRVRPAADGKVLFHRIAVGEHLILGGDNLDLALAHEVERRIARGGKLPPAQWGPLVRICRQAKETLLGKDPPERFTFSVPGKGSRLVGWTQSIELTRDEVRSLLVDGFLPVVKLGEKPSARRSGFQEFGLPYAPDAAITRYLSAFLSVHGTSEAGVTQQGISAARPDLLLFNGGLFESPVLRDRLVEVIASWFTLPGEAAWQPVLLRNDRLDLAVARGAAYYGMVRRGHGVRISGGLAHSYYVGVEADGSAAARESALCLLPAGIEEGQEVDLSGRTFELLIRQPAEFPLYASATRTTDRPGDLLVVDPEQLTSLPPIRTVLQSGKRTVADTVTVRLHAKLTEIGTLEMWCAEAAGSRVWRLQFDVRAATRTDMAVHEGSAETQGFVDESLAAAGRVAIRSAFAKGSAGTPGALIKQLERVTEMSRLQWPASLMRSFWETLMEVEVARRISVEHEARWLNLTGFCLRPGFGLAVDDWRVGQVWRLLPGAVAFAKNELCRAEWWILWRRLAGGLSAGQQKMLAEPLLADWRTWFRKGGSNVKGRWPTFQFGPHESAEVWRLLGSLELLPATMKNELGDMLLDRLAREASAQGREACLFALGRTGARIPVYGPLNALLPPETAKRLVRRLLSALAERPFSNETRKRAGFALVQLSRKTGDRYRDIGEDTRQIVLDWLEKIPGLEHYNHLVRDGGHLESEEQRLAFGESLPHGLRIE